MPETNPTQNTLEHDKILLEWYTPEFMPYPRSATWFLAAGILVLSLISYAIFTGSATMAIVFILLGGAYVLTHNQNPKVIQIRITELGIYVGDQFYPYNAIRAFWIVFKPPFVRKLYLQVGAKSSRELKVELMGQNPVALRQLLAKEIPEIEGGQEALSDIAIRLFRLQ